MKNIFVIGVTGGSGCGKSSFAKQLCAEFGKNKTTIIEQDSYYIDRSLLSKLEIKNINFDHPDSFDMQLFATHLKLIKQGKTIQMPLYDFVSHTRTGDMVEVRPKSIVVVEGILLFINEELRKYFDLKIFIDTDVDIRLIRRMQRDLKHRGRDVDSIITQYLKTVRPMHNKYIEPFKKYADMAIPRNGDFDSYVNLTIEKVLGKVNRE